MDIRIESPFPFESLPRIWKWIESFRGKVADDFAPKTEDEFVCGMCLKWKEQQTWAVYAGGELGGLITFERISPWLGTAHLVLKPDFQGRGIAVKACRAAVAEMFKSGIGKLAFYPLEGNLAIGSLLVNIGARREGKLIAHTLCDGKPTDIWAYGLKKEEFEHAISSTTRSGRNLGADRRRGLGSRLAPVGQAEDHHPAGNDVEHQHLHADVYPGGPAAPAPAPGLPVESAA